MILYDMRHSDITWSKKFYCGGSLDFHLIHIYPPALILQKIYYVLFIGGHIVRFLHVTTVNWNEFVSIFI